MLDEGQSEVDQAPPLLLWPYDLEKGAVLQRFK